MQEAKPAIAGYRRLSQAEIDLINRVKQFEQDFITLSDDVQAHLNSQYAAARVQEMNGDRSETERLVEANPFPWTYLAVTDVQVACMKMNRAIAQPKTRL